MPLTHYTRKDVVDTIIKSIDREPEEWTVGDHKYARCFGRSGTKQVLTLTHKGVQGTVVKLGLFPRVLLPLGLRLGLIGGWRVRRHVQLWLRARTIALTVHGETDAAVPKKT